MLKSIINRLYRSLTGLLLLLGSSEAGVIGDAPVPGAHELLQSQTTLGAFVGQGIGKVLVRRFPAKFTTSSTRSGWSRPMMRTFIVTFVPKYSARRPRRVPTIPSAWCSPLPDAGDNN